MRLRRNISQRRLSPQRRHSSSAPSRRAIADAVAIAASAACRRWSTHCRPNAKAPTALSIAVGAFRRAIVVMIQRAKVNNASQTP
tara:strand:+ start:180 stop:434 length:255 start_codon:yes stop_codon:yes gene_type:complete